LTSRETPPLARCERHGRGRVEQSLLHRVGEIDRRHALRRTLDGANVEEVTFDQLGAEGAQTVRTFVDLVHEGAHRDPAGQQHFRYVPTGLALFSAGCAGDENFCIIHGMVLLQSPVTCCQQVTK